MTTNLYKGLPRLLLVNCCIYFFPLLFDNSLWFPTVLVPIIVYSFNFGMLTASCYEKEMLGSCFDSSNSFFCITSVVLIKFRSRYLRYSYLPYIQIDSHWYSFQTACHILLHLYSFHCSCIDSLFHSSQVHILETSIRHTNYFPAAMLVQTKSKIYDKSTTDGI